MAEAAVIILVVGILILGQFVNIPLKYKVYVVSPLVLLFLGYMWLVEVDSSFYPKVIVTVLVLSGIFTHYKNYRKELAHKQETANWWFGWSKFFIFGLIDAHFKAEGIFTQFSFFSRLRVLYFKTSVRGYIISADSDDFKVLSLRVLGKKLHFPREGYGGATLQAVRPNEVKVR